jgi:hypothetical protein
VPAVTVRVRFTFVVVDAGADAVGVLLVHHTALAPAASFDVMLGSDAQVPLTDPVLTDAASVHTAADATGHATTLIVCARAVELPDTTDTVVVAVPASVPELVRVTGFVIAVTVDENVVVIALVPAIAAPVLPMVTLDAVVPLAVQSAHAADEPPATNTTVRTAASSRRSRRLMR